MYGEIFLRNCMGIIFQQQQSEGVHGEGKVLKLKKFKQPLYDEDMLVCEEVYLQSLQLFQHK
jgi:hypothetical protein